MPYQQKYVSVFDKGIVDKIGDESVPAGTSSASTNFLNLGDRIELVRGKDRLGDNQGATAITYGSITVPDVGGTDHIFVKVGTILKHYNSVTQVWDNAITGLPATEDISLAPYRTPAGAFIFASSPNSGLYRINLANPTTNVNLYDAAKNFKGWITIQDNRMWLHGDVGNSAADVGNEVILRLSWIDNDWPYTDISSEAWDTADGSTTYTNTLAQTLIVGRSLTIVHSQETWTDNGDGTLTGDDSGTGTVNYTTGSVSVTFGSADPGSGAIVANYSYEQPKSQGIADFTYSAPRAAGEGSFFFQGTGSDPIQNVYPYDEKFYVAHKRSWWVVDLTDDDTNATNKIYRESSGIPFREAAVSTGDGIYYIDTVDQKFRRLRYNDIASKVIPESASDQLDLASFVFDDCHAAEFNDFICFTCKSSDDISYNDTMWIYDKQWKLWNKIDAFVQSMSIYNSKLHGASSINGNTFELFSGFDDDGNVIYGNWDANDWNLDASELKKCRRFVVWGDMATSQELIIDVSYDGGSWVELGTIEGTSSYVSSAVSTQYGTTLYGSGSTYGSGETVTAFRYMREFRLKSGKFERIKVRFRTESQGYLNVREYNFRDYRLCLNRVPHRFR